MRKKIPIFLLTLALVFGISFGHRDLPRKSRVYRTEEAIISALGGFSAAEKADYAGLYFDNRGTLVLLFVKGSDALEKAWPSASVREATYSHSDLSKAQALASAHVFAVDGVKTLCLDIVNNRIEIGVRAESNTRQLRNEILALLREKAEPGTFDEKMFFFLNFYKEDEFHLL